MIEHNLFFGIRYGETDQMGYVHHASYIYYLEESRMALFRSVGLDVAGLEKKGVILPVVELDIRYLSPLYYDDSIMVHVSTQEPWSPRLVFQYRIYNQNNKLVTKASNSLVFAEKDTGKLISDPLEYLDCFENVLAEIAIH